MNRVGGADKGLSFREGDLRLLKRILMIKGSSKDKQFDFIDGVLKTCSGSYTISRGYENKKMNNALKERITYTFSSHNRRSYFMKRADEIG